MRCPVCQNLKTEYFMETNNRHGSYNLSEESFVMMKCPNCMTVFPRVKVEKDYYPKYYAKNYYTNSRLTNSVLQYLHYKFNKYYFDLKLGRYMKTDRILDFGCGQGTFLVSLPESIQKFGVEINFRARKYIKKSFPKIKVFSDLDSPELKRFKFDMITMWHVVEHLVEPEKVIRQLSQHLNSNGYLIIATPNIDSRGFRWGKNYWFHLDTPRHLALFKPGNLINICQRIGLQTETIMGEGFKYPLDLFWSIMSRYKTKNLYLNLLLGSIILPVTLLVKTGDLFFPKHSETVILVLKK